MRAGRLRQVVFPLKDVAACYQQPQRDTKAAGGSLAQAKPLCGHRSPKSSCTHAVSRPWQGTKHFEDTGYGASMQCNDTSYSKSSTIHLIAHDELSTQPTTLCVLNPAFPQCE